MNKRLIYAEDAIEAINGMPDCPNGYSDTYDKKHIIAVLEDVPSAQPEQIARDIATIIENEKDMRVILQNAERTETHSCVYELKKAATDVMKRLNDRVLPTHSELLEMIQEMHSCDCEHTKTHSCENKHTETHESCTDCPLYDHDRHNCPRFNKVIPTAIPDAQQRWIPIKWHDCTDEEREEYGFAEEIVAVFDCEMPKDKQEILVTTSHGYVEQDVCYIDDGFSLDSGYDWIEDITAWMPKPAPYKEGQND